MDSHVAGFALKDTSQRKQPVQVKTLSQFSQFHAKLARLLVLRALEPQLNVLHVCLVPFKVFFSFQSQFAQIPVRSAFLLRQMTKQTKRAANRAIQHACLAKMKQKLAAPSALQSLFCSVTLGDVKAAAQMDGLALLSLHILKKNRLFAANAIHLAKHAITLPSTALPALKG